MTIFTVTTCNMHILVYLERGPMTTRHRAAALLARPQGQACLQAGISLSLGMVNWTLIRLILDKQRSHGAKVVEFMSL